MHLSILHAFINVYLLSFIHAFFLHSYIFFIHRFKSSAGFLLFYVFHFFILLALLLVLNTIPFLPCFPSFRGLLSSPFTLHDTYIALLISLSFIFFHSFFFFQPISLHLSPFISPTYPFRIANGFPLFHDFSAPLLSVHVQIHYDK